MNNLLQYLVESGLALLLFYAVYRLLLSQQTCFTFNRFYLLAALLLSLVIPFLELPNWPTEPEPPAKVTFGQVPAGEVVYATPIIPATPAEIMPAAATTPEPEQINYWVWLYGIYVIGLFVAGLLFCRQFLKLYSFIYSHLPNSYYWQRIKIIPTQGKLATFSFLRYILFDNTQPFTPVQKELILRHEQAHLAQKHSLDILLIKLLSIFLWFNPLLYFYRKALESTHEYLADAQVLQSENTESYADLLVQQVLSNTSFSLGNFFHLRQSLTLNRLAMIKKFKPTTSHLRPLLALPVICALSLAFAANRPVSLPEILPASLNSSALNSGLFGDKNFNPFKQSAGYVPDPDSKTQAPVFPGGKEQLYRFFLQNLKFTPEALDKHNYIGLGVKIKIDKEGNPEVIIDSDKDLKGQDIARIEKRMPRWAPAHQQGKPVASEYFINIRFKEFNQRPTSAPEEVLTNANAGWIKKDGTPVFGSDEIYMDLKSAISLSGNSRQNNYGYSLTDISEPAFPNGKEHLYRFLLQHLKFKPEAFGKDAIRRTVVSIKIDAAGNPEIVSPQKNDLINEEISRVINFMPRWVPAYQAEKGLASRYELHFIINRKAKHSAIALNRLAKNGSLNHEGVPTFSSDIIHVGINPVTGTPKNILDQVDIVEGEIVEPTFPGGKAAMERYFRENLDLRKVVGEDLANTKEFGWGSNFNLPIDQNGNIEKLALKENSPNKTDRNLAPHQLGMGNIGNNFRNELVGLINNMPQWKPATQDGKPIRAKIDLSFGLLHTEEPGLSDKRTQIYLIDQKGTLNFLQERIKFWIPSKTGTPTSGDNSKNLSTVTSPVSPPQFPGGEAELNKFLSRNMKYPARGLELKDSFTWVIITVKIDKNGNPEKTTLPMKDVFIKEAFRVANLLPKFEPAKINGEPVASEYEFSIYFRYDSDTTRIDNQKSQATFKIVNGVPTARSKAIVVTTFANKSTLGKEIDTENKILKPTGGQKPPQFPGGKTAYQQFIGNHTQYPATALKSKISGQAVMQATIGTDGRITNIKTLHADHNSFEQEAISVLREMPRWEPGLKNGQAAEFSLVFPFVFALESKQNIPALRLPANRSQLYVQDAINIIGYSQIIAGKTFVKKSVTPSGNNIKTEKPEPVATKPAPVAKKITPPKTNTPAPADEPIFSFVEQQPVFKGGEQEMNKFIKAHLKYPAEAKEKAVSGLVVIQFTVSKTGQVLDPKVVKPLGAGTDEAAIQMVNKMPPFSPAKQNGKPVNFRYTLPIRFDIPPKETTGATPDAPELEKIFTFVEMQPQFPGGEVALRNFIKKELKYPQSIQSQNSEGLVVVQFIIDENGKISNPKVVKSLGFGFDQEALRVVKLMPTFKPARQNRRPVSFRYTLPIRFALATEEVGQKEAK